MSITPKIINILFKVTTYDGLDATFSTKVGTEPLH